MSQKVRCDYRISEINCKTAIVANGDLFTTEVFIELQSPDKRCKLDDGGYRHGLRGYNLVVWDRAVENKRVVLPLFYKVTKAKHQILGHFNFTNHGLSNYLANKRCPICMHENLEVDHAFDQWLPATGFSGVWNFLCYVWANFSFKDLICGCCSVV